MTNNQNNISAVNDDSRIVLYQPTETLSLQVRLERETVWLNRQQIAKLFDRDVKTIGKHINNALKEELAQEATVAKFATVQIEGDREVMRQVEHYNLDVILSVGYRVKSGRGVQFRRWANAVLRRYLLQGYSVNRHLIALQENMDKRMSRIEDTQVKQQQQLDFFIHTTSRDGVLRGGLLHRPRGSGEYNPNSQATDDHHRCVRVRSNA